MVESNDTANTSGSIPRPILDLPHGSRVVQALAMRRIEPSLDFPHGRAYRGPRMRSATACLLVLSIGFAARAAEPDREAARWLPAFGVFFDMLGQKASGSVRPGDILGTPLTTGGCVEFLGPGPAGSQRGDLCHSNRFGRVRNQLPFPKAISPTDEGNDTSIAPLVGASLELMTPSLLETLWGPRLFARAEVAHTFGFERFLAGAFSPGDFTPAKSGVGDPDIEEASVGGQGSRAKLQLEPLAFSGGAGLAFGARFFGRRLRIKPSFEYLFQEVELLGTVHRAVKLQERPAGQVQFNTLNDFRLIDLHDDKKVQYHGYGPGLELEVDTARLGSFMTSVYLMGRGYYFFGNLEETLSATSSDPNGCNATACESASWTFELDRWAWRSGVGFRVRWQPEAD